MALTLKYNMGLSVYNVKYSVPVFNEVIALLV